MRKMLTNTVRKPLFLCVSERREKGGREKGGEEREREGGETGAKRERKRDGGERGGREGEREKGRERGGQRERETERETDVRMQRCKDANVYLIGLWPLQRLD